MHEITKIKKIIEEVLKDVGTTRLLAVDCWLQTNDLDRVYVCINSRSRSIGDGDAAEYIAAIKRKSDIQRSQLKLIIGGKEESAGIKQIRKNMREFNKRQKKLEKIRAAENRQVR